MGDKLCLITWLQYHTFCYFNRKEDCHYLPWSAKRVSVVWGIMAYHNFLTSQNIEIFQRVPIEKYFNLETQLHNEC